VYWAFELHSEADLVNGNYLNLRRMYDDKKELDGRCSSSRQKSGQSFSISYTQ